jgi:DNA-binding NarL/FixJ family response regulator
MINLMLVEDNDIVREALADFFGNEQDMRVVAEAANAAAAIEHLQGGSAIDVVIADWNMPDMNGLELTTHITAQFPQIKTIILTMHSKQDYKDRAKAAGAKGYILKGEDFDELVVSVKDVAAGKTVFK